MIRSGEPILVAIYLQMLGKVLITYNDFFVDHSDFEN